jgi:hypothetical protein
VKILRSLFAAATCAAVLGACADQPAQPNVVQPEPKAPLQPLGVYSVTITGVDGSGGVSSSRAVAVPADGSEALNPAAAGLVFESVSTTTYSEGTRTTGGQRFIVATFRVRNNTGLPVSNLTLVPVERSNTIAGTPFNSLLLFSGAAAPSSIASQIVPTGAVALGDDGRIRSPYSDVLQVFTEAEVAAVSLPAGTTGIFPYGFVVRNPGSTSNRTLPAATTSSDWGLVTFAFRYPLQATAAGDPFSISFQFLGVEDTETRMTESFEERQDTSGVRRLRERATALGATTVTVLAGSSALEVSVIDYPGQRQVCSVRTAGTAASPVTYITNPGAYTDLLIYRPGESVDACGANFATGTPTVAASGVAYNLTVRAMDRYGNVRTAALDSVRLSRVAGPAATLQPTATALTSGVATVPVTWTANGTSLLRAVGRNVVGQTRTIDVGGASVAAFAGSNQAAMAGTALPTKPAVRVLDGNGSPVVGRSVTFAVATGGGSVTTATVSTDASGVATVGNWTLGATAQLNTLTATVSGGVVTNNPITFNASGCENGTGTGYVVTVCYTSDMTVSQRSTFQTAASRWGSVITGDLSNIALNIPSGQCISWLPAMNATVDDLVIFARIVSIDGAGGVLGSAGPCHSRNSNSLPVSGLMQFDVADVANLEAAGQFSSVILHEMGHVLGIGSIWTTFGLLQTPSSAGSPLDTYFNGANGIAGFNSIGGSTYTGGQKVPVENTGGAGTINAHWRESVLQNELMTGYLNGGVANPLSLLTVRSLSDMGYTANTGAADSFFLTLTLRDRPEEPGLHLQNDVYNGPRYTVDAAGRFSRIPGY